MHIKYVYENDLNRVVRQCNTTYTLDTEREKYFNKLILSLQTNRNDN